MKGGEVMNITKNTSFGIVTRASCECAGSGSGSCAGNCSGTGTAQTLRKKRAGQS